MSGADGNITIPHPVKTTQVILINLVERIFHTRSKVENLVQLDSRSQAEYSPTGGSLLTIVLCYFVVTGRSHVLSGNKVSIMDIDQFQRGEIGAIRKKL